MFPPVPFHSVPSSSLSYPSRCRLKNHLTKFKQGHHSRVSELYGNELIFLVGSFFFFCTPAFWNFVFLNMFFFLF